jgi:hypothetical protein
VGLTIDATPPSVLPELENQYKIYQISGVEYSSRNSRESWRKGVTGEDAEAMGEGENLLESIAE